ncbi:dihydrolipoamide acetyltransferase [Corallococcus sp. AB038B]|uniref:dihydrolipoamide acetyltransferase n=3 Tax=Corallococcus TaxID=83461 RepID=UPI000EE3FCD2|nr:dihydrolipoamide acetyltransferase [Corallococcus sp. AB038B]RKI05095.1 dihydrolipoamide acetyltransferase [Corallococcus sp. AB038B]
MRVATATLRLLALLSAGLPGPVLAQGASPSPASPPPAAAASPAAGTPQAPAAKAPAGDQTADEAFTSRVKTLEEQVVDLKEKIYRSKARLLLLQESVMGGELSTGARAVLVHKNEMGNAFQLESVVYALDGAPIFTQVDTQGDLNRHQSLEVFNGRIVPGQHQLAVRLVYRGSGYGVFSYLEGYKFKVQSSYTFNAESGKVTTVNVVGVEKGGLTTDLKDRPAVRYDIEVAKDTRANRPAGPGSEPEGASGTPAAPATTSSELK